VRNWCFAQCCFLAQLEDIVLKVSFCDGPLSVVYRPCMRPCMCLCVSQQFYLNIFLLVGFWSNFTGMITGWWPTKVVQTVQVGYISWSRGQKIYFQNAFSKIFLSKTTSPRAFIFVILHHLEVLYQSCLNYSPGVKIDPTPRVTILH